MNGVSLSSSLPVPPTPVALPRYPWWHWRRLGFNFLTISIAAHLLFGVAATYLIVQTIQAKRKQTFAGPPQSPNAPTRALEHKVQMQKKQATMSAPAPVKRITTTSNSKVALPAMPAMPKMDSQIVPVAMAGMGGTGVGLGMGSGGGSGSGGSGGGLSLFGLRENKGGGALMGTFFDLKQTPDQRATPIAKNGPNNRPTPEADNEYSQVMSQYVLGGMNDSTLATRFFKGPNPLYATQIFIPSMSASEGPKAFSLQGRVQPSRWLVHYRGAVIPPEGGSYHFVGVGDDVLVVRFNGSVVLDSGGSNPSGRKPLRYYASEGLNDKASGFWGKGSGEGTPFSVEAGKTYPIDILISEHPGGYFKAWLMIAKDGVEYKKDSRNCPILPLFRLSKGTLPKPTSEAPLYDPDGPVWKATAASAAPVP